MMGFLTSLLEEFWTGKSTLQQIGVVTPSLPVLVTLSVLASGATLFGTVQTLVKAQTGKLEPRYESCASCHSPKTLIPQQQMCRLRDALRHRAGLFFQRFSVKA